MARILLARHGLSSYETDLMTDDGGSLTPQGRRQARALGDVALAAGVTKVWCSPMSRAVQTAELAAAVAGVDEVEVRQDLREYSVGDFAGRSLADEAALLMPVFEAWMAGDDLAMVPGADQTSAIVQRVSRVLEQIATELGPDGVALVVSHGGAIMTTVPVLTGGSRNDALNFVLGGGANLVLVRDETGWSLEG